MLLSTKKYSVLAFMLLLITFSHAQSQNMDEIPEFVDLSGNPVSFDEFKGQITVINFWATWCAACLKEMPELEKLHQSLSQEQVKVVGVVVMSDTGKIDQMLKITGVNYPVFIGTRQHLQNLSHSLIIPQTIILDAQGNILMKFEGAQNVQVISQYIKDYLNQVNLSTHNPNDGELTKD